MAAAESMVAARRALGHRIPVEPALVAPGEPPLAVQREEVQPAVVEERPDPVVAPQDLGHGRPGGFHADGEPQRLVGEPCAVVHRLPGQAGPQQT